MKNIAFIKHAKMAQQLEKNLNFSQASDFWLMAFRYARNSENQSWCNARFLVCEYMDMLSRKGMLPSCYHNVARNFSLPSLDKGYASAYPALFDNVKHAI